MRLFLRLFPALGALILFALLCTATSVQGVAATLLIVTTTADAGAGSLRQALADAKTGTRFSSIPRSMGRPLA